MRRSDREITDFQELITVMRGCDVCRLALHDEPYPYILPLNFGLEVDGETVRLYFHGANTGTKYDLIAKNPNVAFEMDRGHALILDDEHGNCTMTYESVIGQGRISVVPDADKERTNKSGLGGMKMPLRYVCEMVCDRVAASQIYLGDKYTDASPWQYYEKSKDHYLLHPETRALLEKLLLMVRDLGQERTFAYIRFLLGCEDND